MNRVILCNPFQPPVRNAMPAYLPDPGSSKPPPEWLVRLLSVVLGIGVLIIAVFLGGVILVTGVVVGLGLWAWLWWQRRKMVRMMKESGDVDPAAFGAQFGARGFGRRPGGQGGPAGQAGPGAVGGSAGRADDDSIIEGDYEVIDEEKPPPHRPPR